MMSDDREEIARKIIYKDDFFKQYAEIVPEVGERLERYVFDIVEILKNKEAELEAEKKRREESERKYPFCAGCGYEGNNFKNYENHTADGHDFSTVCGNCGSDFVFNNRNEGILALVDRADSTESQLTQAQERIKSLEADTGSVTGLVAKFPHLMEYVSQMEKQISQLQSENAVLVGALKEHDDLMRESKGVAGLHLNGDIAEWDWLINNKWLANHDIALANSPNSKAYAEAVKYVLDKANKFVNDYEDRGKFAPFKDRDWVNLTNLCQALTQLNKAMGV